MKLQLIINISFNKFSLNLVVKFKNVTSGLPILFRPMRSLPLLNFVIVSICPLFVNAGVLLTLITILSDFCGARTLKWWLFVAEFCGDRFGGSCSKVGHLFTFLPHNAFPTKSFSAITFYVCFRDFF